MVGAWCFGCLSGPLGFTGWISFARYSFLFTVESLSLLYLLVISWFICSWKWCIDKLGACMQTKYLCVFIHIWIKGEVGAMKQVSVSKGAKIRNRYNQVPHLTQALRWNILLTIPRRYFFCGCFMVFFVLSLLCLCVRLFICALWSPAGKGLTSWLSFVVSDCEFVTFPLESWVRCGTWLYLFLIFAPLLTFYSLQYTLS